MKVIKNEREPISEGTKKKISKTIKERFALIV